MQTNFTTLLKEVFEERGIDFSRYREKLLERRIETRIRATRKDSYEDYINFLRGNRHEMDALLDALTINTTHFFRDHRVFDAVAKKIIPVLFNREWIEKNRIVRIWSCGSSGGEELTTVLILILEYLETTGVAANPHHIQLFGTDIDKWSLDKAHDGVYDEFEFKETPSELKKKYFIEMGNGRFWRKKELNRFLKFKRHDIVGEEPVKHVDLILCRNVFIYFKRELQELCLEKFHRSLSAGGFLVLGLTEGLWGASAGKFRAFDDAHRIYQK